MSSDSSSTATTVDAETCQLIRATIVKGIHLFLEKSRTELLASFGNSPDLQIATNNGNFHDLEIAVNKNDLTSSNCANLTPEEVALFVRMTERFEDENDTRTPRCIMFGIVMRQTPKRVHPAHKLECRLWDAFEPKWQGDKSALERSDPSRIKPITDDLMLAMWKACKMTNPNYDASNDRPGPPPPERLELDGPRLLPDV